VSDYWAVPFLATMHRVAADNDEAGAQALAAGIDVELPDTLGFGPGLVDRVRRGELPEALVDRAARRLLTQKVQLGLLDPDWTPEGSVANAASIDLDSLANRALTREVAERSVILLDAGTALPLVGDGLQRCGRSL
jgi:beta-glucosidase-like glycosyl hydrolase